MRVSKQIVIEQRKVSLSDVERLLKRLSGGGSFSFYRARNRVSSHVIDKLISIDDSNVVTINTIDCGTIMVQIDLKGFMSAVRYPEHQVLFTFPLVGNPDSIKFMLEGNPELHYTKPKR